MTPATAGDRCEVAFTKTIQPIKIADHHKIVFSTNDFSIFSDPNYHIDKAVLEISVKGKQDEIKEYSLALNGTRITHPRGKWIFHFKDAFKRKHQHDKSCKHKDDDDQEIRANLKDLLIDARQRLPEAVSEIHRKKGMIVIWVNGHLKVVAASLRVEGTRISVQCDGSGNPTPTPTATPTPTPVAPQVNIQFTTPDSALTNSTTQSIEFGADQENVSFSCSLDGQSAQVCTSPIVYSALENGSHHFQVTATNVDGLTSSPAVYDWSIDTVPFDVSLDRWSPDAPVTNLTSMTMEFSASEASSGNAFQCSLDGAGYQPCTSPVTFSALLEGKHSINILGTDAAGNTSLQPAHYEWAIDLTPPSAQINQFDGSQFFFSANESASFECSFDQSSFTACQSPVTMPELAEGTHQLEVRATDAAGNSGISSPYQWVIDRTAPTVTLGNVIPAPGLTNGHQLSVEFFASETSSFTCSIDGAEATPCTSPLTSEVNTEGNHSVTILATDGYGNVSVAAVSQWTMDFTSPQISFGVSSPAATSYLASHSISIEVKSTEPITYTSQLDGMNLNQSSSPIQLSGLSDGPHLLIVNGVDAVGNAANTLTYAFTVDTIAPIASITGSTVSGNTRQSSNSISFASNEAGSFECDFDGSGYSACNSPFTVSGLVEGAHLLKVRAIDFAGNKSAAASFSWSIDFTPPQTVLTSMQPSASVTRSTSMAIQFASNDSSANSYCSWDGASPVACISPASISNLGEGTHSFRVYAVDANGNVESPGASYSWNIDLTAPITVINSVSPSGTTINTNQISISFSTNDYAISYCSLDGGASTPCVSPKVFDQLSDGSHTITIYSVDAIGNVESPGVSHTFTVDTRVPLETYISSFSPATSVTSQRTMSISFYSNLATATYVCSLDGSAQAPCTSPVNYQNLTDGIHQFVVRSVDDAGNVVEKGATYSWTVDGTAPTILTSSATVTKNSMTVTWTTSEPASTALLWGLGSATGNTTTEDFNYSTTHTVTISGLTANTVYSYIIRGQDAAGNTYSSARRSVRTAQ